MGIQSVQMRKPTGNFTLLFSYLETKRRILNVDFPGQKLVSLVKLRIDDLFCPVFQLEFCLLLARGFQTRLNSRAETPESQTPRVLTLEVQLTLYSPQQSSVLAPGQFIMMMHCTLGSLSTRHFKIDTSR